MTTPSSPRSPGMGERVGLVFLGGAAGALLRYLLLMATPGPAGVQLLTIFAINVLGALLLGYLVGALRHWPDPRALRLRLLLGTGALGGFTTYSTFALQTLQAAGDGAWFLTVRYAALSVVLGIGAAALGLRWGTRQSRRAKARRPRPTGAP